jgi:rRNA maturation endonuclease Nob1
VKEIVLFLKPIPQKYRWSKAFRVGSIVEFSFCGVVAGTMSGFSDMKGSVGFAASPEDVRKNLDVLVIDSGAIIKGHGANFHKIANRMVTVEEVIAEIRDSKSREILLRLPFELEICNPSDEAMTAVAKFAEKSGDFASLSLTDLKVMALSYQFEVAINNKKYIREEPVDNKTLEWRQNQQRSGNPTAVPATVKRTPQPAAPVAKAEEAKQDFKQSDAIASTTMIADNVEEGTNNKLAPCDDEEEVGEEDGDYVDGEYYDDDEEYYSGEESNDEEDSEGEEGAAEDEPFSLENDEDFPVLGLEGFTISDDASAPDASAGAEITTSGWGANMPKPAVSVTNTASDDTIITSGEEGEEQQQLSTQSVDATLTATKSRQFDGSSYFHKDVRKKAEKEMQAQKLKQPESQSVTDPGISSTSRILGTSSGGASGLSNAHAAMEDDGVGWISASNMKDCIATGKGMIGSTASNATAAAAAAAGKAGGELVSAAKAKKSNSNKKQAATKGEDRVVGCVTTDFTMQNVLIQMNLHVVDVEGMKIHSVKQWVLRCMACFTIHYDMDRHFCSKCGVNHLSRVACSIDSKTGQLRLHMKKGYVANKKGKVHSLPLPGKQGRFQGELLLREDQLLTGIWRQKAVKMQKDVRSAFGQDITSDVGLHINKSQAIKVGLGRFNPNADKGRERRGAKKKKGKK